MIEPSIWSQVFSAQSGVLTFFGALGGAVRSATLKTTWRDGLRVTFIGGSTAFGVGVLAPFILRPYIGELPPEMNGALGTLCASSFVVGLIAVTMIEKFLAGRGLKD